MIYVYALKSFTHNYIYVSMTNNLERRIKEHNRGKEKTTSYYKPFGLILSEKLPNRIEARKREKFLKSGCGKEYLRTLIS